MKAKLDNFTKKQPIALGCALAVMALGAAIYFRRDTLADAKTQLVAKTEERNHIVSNVTDSTHLTEQYTALAQATQAIEARLVRADRLATNLQYFYKLESDTQTKLIDLRQSGVIKTKEPRKTGYVAIGYSVSVQGSYTKMMNFLRRIENSEHFSRLATLTLTHAAGQVSSTDLTLQLEIELLGLP